MGYRNKNAGLPFVTVLVICDSPAFLVRGDVIVCDVWGFIGGQIFCVIVKGKILAVRKIKSKARPKPSLLGAALR